MTQQTPPSKRKFDRSRFKRKLSRALINVSNEIDNMTAEPREVRFVSIDDGRRIKPTILVELPPVGDDEQS